jgi:DNA-binding beta-propeller fold protein YncE
VHVLDLYQQQRGAELRSLALSNPVPGQPRRAYVSAVLYDADLATATGVRPAYDVGGVVMVLDLVENVAGAPDYRLVRVLDAGLGAGQIRVLPPRAGKRDLVVWTNSSAGTVTVYDDEVGAVARVLTYDPVTGAPVAGREPFGLAVADAGASATVYLAAFGSSTVSVLDVPLASPGQASLRDGRIGKEFIP